MKKVNVLILMAIFVFNSCKKSDLAKVVEKCRVVSIGNGQVIMANYSYDLAGRVSKVSNVYPGIDYYVNGVFTYEPGVVTFEQNVAQHNEPKRWLLTDNSGRVIKESILGNPNYIYDAAGYLIYKDFRGFSSVHNDFRLIKSVISYAKDNLVKVVIDEDITVIITYYENELSQNLLGFENALSSNLIFGTNNFVNLVNSSLNLTENFRGKGSKNLVKTITRHATGKDGLMSKVTDIYTYQKDSSGKVILAKINRDYHTPGNSQFLTYSFAYECP